MSAKKIIVIEKLGKNYCVSIRKNKSNHVVFYSQDSLTSDTAFFECRDVALALKIALGHKDMTLYYTDVNDAARRFNCDESELKGILK